MVSVQTLQALVVLLAQGFPTVHRAPWLLSVQEDIVIPILILVTALALLIPVAQHLPRPTINQMEQCALAVPNALADIVAQLLLSAQNLTVLQIHVFVLLTVRLFAPTVSIKSAVQLPLTAVVVPVPMALLAPMEPRAVA